MINYGRIQQTMDFWERSGFKRIETPWTVTQAISDITRPALAQDFKLIHDDNKVLVASGEQGFLYLYNKGFLPKGKFQTTTPCFRKEPFGPFHTKYFIKTEIIDTEHVNEDNLSVLVAQARQNFTNLLPDGYPEESIVVIDTSYHLGYPSFDIELNGLEIGSYGIRSCSFLDWIYGTGIAEPRFTKAERSRK